MFRGITKINGIPNSVDHGVHNLHSHFDIQTFEVNNDDVTHDIHEHFSPPQHTLFFVMEMKRRFIFHLQVQILQELVLVNCLVCKEKLIK